MLSRLPGDTRSIVSKCDPQVRFIRCRELRNPDRGLALRPYRIHTVGQQVKKYLSEFSGDRFDPELLVLPAALDLYVLRGDLSRSKSIDSSSNSITEVSSAMPHLHSGPSLSPAFSFSATGP